MTELLEAMMVICFGVSWPMSIIKSYKSKTAKGKSLFFLCLVAFGYLCGVIWKITVWADTGVLKYPSVFYLINLIMVIADMVLYFRNDRFDKKLDAAKD